MSSSGQFKIDHSCCHYTQPAATMKMLSMLLLSFVLSTTALVHGIDCQTTAQPNTTDTNLALPSTSSFIENNTEPAVPTPEQVGIIRRQDDVSPWFWSGGCPTYNEQVITTTTGWRYRIRCGIDSNAPGSAGGEVRSFDQCANMCHNGTWPNCNAVVYAPSNRQCYEKRLGSQWSTNQNSRVLLAEQVGPPLPSVIPTTTRTFTPPAATAIFTSIVRITSTLISAYLVPVTSITSRTATFITSGTLTATRTSILPDTTILVTSLQVIPSTIVTTQTIPIVVSSLTTRTIITVVPTTIVATAPAVSVVTGTRTVLAENVQTVIPVQTFQVTVTATAG
ncbi:hypothetical protein CERZMDRAFT_101090 [Cercospora zeae-maydis SCOH1-5]|uniref:Apple domain-containing protein n=1 Tax=Cercospora zeae-maydis SCOH1-5 TaxID=717836 RepID=A0A6A6F2D8_9PEZI|nr:hypothetical protein CERZMDRAFT_101090 [Cercospora zeae-maydis SCOH1-5]